MASGIQILTTVGQKIQQNGYMDAMGVVMSDFETEDEVSAYYQGLLHGAGEYERELNTRKAIEGILTDLIAELRAHCIETCLYDIALSADRAEARLKGLNDV